MSAEVFHAAARARTGSAVLHAGTWSDSIVRCARAVLASAAPVCPHSSAHHTGLGTRFAARLLLPVSIIFGGYRLGAARVASADNESHSRRDVSGDVSNAHALRRRSPPSRDDRTRGRPPLIPYSLRVSLAQVLAQWRKKQLFYMSTSMAPPSRYRICGGAEPPAGVGATVNLRPCRLCYWRRRLLLM